LNPGGGAKPAGGAPPKAGGGNVPGNDGGPVFDVSVALSQTIGFSYLLFHQIVVGHQGSHQDLEELLPYQQLGPNNNKYEQ